MNHRYIHTTLEKKPELTNEALKLIESSFNYKPPFSFSTDFALLFNSTNLQHCFIVYDTLKKIVVTHIGVSLRLLGNTNFHVPVALIGGIASHPDYRGKGHFKSLLNNVLKHFEDKMAMFILWGNHESIYKKFNFFQAGGQIETGILKFQRETFPLPTTLKSFDQLSTSEFQFIKDLYELQTCKSYTTFLRSQNDWLQIKKIYSTQLYLCHEENKLVGYFCLGKGFDLPDIIHEIGFLEPYKSKYIPLLTPYKLWMPINNELQLNQGNLLYLALFRPASTSLFSSMIQHLTSYNIMIHKLEESLISYSIQGKSYIDTTENFLRQIFGPDPYFENCQDGPPLFFSGLDSV